MGLDQRLWIRGTSELSSEGPQVPSDVCADFAAWFHDGVIISRWYRFALEPAFSHQIAYDDPGQWRCDKSV